MSNLPEKIKITELPEKVDIRKGFNSGIQERDYVLPSFPLGKLGILASAGGTGKSIYGLQMLFQIAAGKCCDFELNKTSMTNDPSRTLYISLEDEDEDIDSRLSSLWNFWRHDAERSSWLDDLSDLVDILALAKVGETLIKANGEKTELLNLLETKIRSENYRFIIIDTLRLTHDGDENDNGFMTQILRYFNQLARQTKSSILLLHHENKGGSGDSDAGAGSVRGASAIVDNSRYVARMQTMTPDEGKKRGYTDDERRFWVRVSLEKTNYGPPQEAVWLKRMAGGILMSETPNDAVEGKITKGVRQNG